MPCAIVWPLPVDDIRTGTWITHIGGRASSLEIRRCRLSVLAGPDAGKTVDLGSSWFRVGARKGCDLVLSDQRVSGHHLEIRLDNDGFRLRDLESTNGTFVAGHRVREVYLNPGTVIYVGDSRLRFEPLDQSVSVKLSEDDRFGRMVGRSVAMRALFAKLERLAPTDASLLVTGETGTGKELVAEAVHERSKRKNGPFVVFDCGSVAENLIAGELFGHERGAFTGAVASRPGVFEQADGGTVFLDEIGELPIDLQPKLLGVLERRTVRRIGGQKEIPVDIRVVSATNRNLAKEMNLGRFREDLYYRISVVRVHLAPLRDRLDDIDLLVANFLAQLPGGQSVKLHDKTMHNLRNHDYPGNVRELRNLLERAVIMAGELATNLTGGPSRPRVASENPASPADPSASPSPESAPAPHPEPSLAVPNMRVPIDVSVPFKLAKSRMVEEFERRFLERLLDEHGGNVSKAARVTGLDRMTVHKMLARRGIDKRRR